jgi:hypothetical protein
MMAIHMLKGADGDRYRNAIKDFECAYLMDCKNTYPKTLNDCYTLLKGWKKSASLKRHPMKQGVLFNTVGDHNEVEGAGIHKR